MDVYKAGPVILNGTTIAEYTSRSIARGITSFVNRGGGFISPSFIAMLQDQPVLSLTSPALKSILDITGVAGVAVTTVDLFFLKEVHGASEAAGSNHVKITINDGMIIPRRITAGNDGEAEIAFDIVVSWDGTNATLVYSGSQARPASSDTAEEKYVVGDVDIAGSLYDVQTVDFDLGITEYTAGTKGEVALRHVSNRTQAPIVTWTTLDIGMVDTIGMEGAAKAAQFYFKKVSEAGGRVADNVAEHIGITVADSYTHPGDISDADGAEVTAEIITNASYNGSDTTLALDTTMAIA